MSFDVAVDIGGTFTDLVAIDRQTGRTWVEKTSSDARAPIAAVLGVIERAQVPPAEIDLLIHGTTVTTNALLERSGTRVAFITNTGFRDVIFIQHGNRRDLYGFKWKKPLPLAARRDCLEVDCRMDSRGTVVRPLPAADVDAIVAYLREQRIGAVAISLLFSYLNPEHELELAARLREALPDLTMSLSHLVYPRWRENDRGHTTIADAYLKPMFGRYVENLRDGLRDAGTPGELLVMKSNGGVVNAESAREQPVDYLVSGPVGGVLGGAYFASLAGLDRIMTIDIGGTSCDVSLLIDGEAKRSNAFPLDVGMPICAPMVDVHTIGAGGGSIAWIDAGGLLRVGPESAGADPGPACYGHGGTRATLTDANLLLGRLNPDAFAGRQIQLDPGAARAAVEALAEPLGLTVEDAAHAIVDLANHNMVNALNVISVEQGVDPRDCALVAFGGAGALHAVEIAAILGVDTVLVPPHPGNVSAFGLLTAGLRSDLSTTLVLRSDAPDAIARLNETLGPIRERALANLRRDGFQGTPQVEAKLDMRYYGQNHFREVEIADRLPLDEAGWNAVLEAFHRSHELAYGYALRSDVVEIVGVTVTTVGERSGATPAFEDADPAAAADAVRPMYFREAGWSDGQVLQRESMLTGAAHAGPLIVEERLSTTLVPPGASVTRHPSGSLVIAV